jgi:hypothetical protein
MSEEANIAGVFLPGLLMWGILAIVIGIVVRRVLSYFDLYRFVWHRGLFDISLSVILWGTLAWLGATAR